MNGSATTQSELIARVLVVVDVTVDDRGGVLLLMVVVVVVVLVDGIFRILTEQLLHLPRFQNLLVVVQCLQLLVKDEGVVQRLRDVVVLAQVLVDGGLLVLKGLD